MIDKTKAPGCVGAQSGARQESSLAGAVPCSNSTTNSAARQSVGRIFDLLLEGEENAVPARDLATVTGLSPRGLRRAIDAERERGLPVLASDSGYFAPSPGPAGLQEVKRFLRRQDSRCAANRRVVAPLRRMLRAAERGPLDGQMMIGEEDGDGTAQNVQP